MPKDEDIPDWVLWMLLAFAVLDIVYALMSLYLMSKNVPGGWPWTL